MMGQTPELPRTQAAACCVWIDTQRPDASDICKDRKDALTTIDQLSLILRQLHHLSAGPMAGLDGTRKWVYTNAAAAMARRERSKIASYTARYPEAAH